MDVAGNVALESNEKQFNKIDMRHSLCTYNFHEIDSPHLSFRVADFVNASGDESGIGG